MNGEVNGSVEEQVANPVTTVTEAHNKDDITTEPMVHTDPLVNRESGDTPEPNYDPEPNDTPELNDTPMSNDTPDHNEAPNPNDASESMDTSEPAENTDSMDTTDTIHPSVEADHFIGTDSTNEAENLESNVNGIKSVESEEVYTEDDSTEGEPENLPDDDISEKPKTNEITLHPESEGGEDENSVSEDCKDPLEDATQPKEVQKSNGCTKTGDVHEILTDNEEDCVITEVPKPAAEPKMQLRRSSRAIKRKRYDDDSDEQAESEEEFVISESPKRRPKPIVINDTKALVAMAARQIKSGIQKKEPTVVIIDTNNSPSSNKPQLIRKNPFSSPISSSISAQNLYQSIVARGTTVTPLSSKNSNVTIQNTPPPTPTPTPQPVILPSLTDDMFVVEVPSFIVPYVYEKPSVEPFREFVDKLGNELMEQKAKDDLKKKEQKDKIQKEKQENGDDGNESEEELKEGIGDLEELLIQNKEKKEPEGKKGRRRHKTDDDDESWNGDSSGDSTDDLEDDDDIDLEKSGLTEKKDLTSDNIGLPKSDNYFDLSLGKFFMKIGLNLVKQYVQNDLLKQQNLKLRREHRAGNPSKATEQSVASLKKNLELSKETNASYMFRQKKCEFCTFKSESRLALAHHLETPHMKNNVYKCNFCIYEIKSPHDILFHMETVHNTRGKLERAPAYHQCANCPFEDNGKGKLARHLIACAKRFKPNLNLAPPFEWEPPAKIPKIAKPRNTIMAPYQNNFHRGQVGNNFGLRPIMNNMITSGNFRARARPMGIPPRPIVQGIPIIRGNVTVRQHTPNQAMLQNNVKGLPMPKAAHQPSISITPLPRHPQPIQQQPSQQQNKNSCVICEICDGYIKDLEQLRNHMQWIHRVKIHPKMIHNRPPLNCQKCQFRFFTDQGLERHLLGSHGLVTKSMQEEANKGNDGGRCPVCGRVYQWKLLDHVARDHNLTLKPAHLSYKCTVCSATFGLYKQFENHVYSAHSVVAKRVMDKGKPATQPAKTNQSLLKPLKINDEITIIPQPAKSNSPASGDK